MNRYLYILFVFTIFPLFSYSQNSKIDSLLNEVKKNNIDTNKLISLNLLSRQYNNIGEYDSALFYIASALELSKKIHFNPNDSVSQVSLKKQIAISYNIKGIICDNKGEYDVALQNYFTSLKIRKEIGDIAGESASFNNIGLIYEQLGNYPEAIKYHLASLKISEKLANNQSIASSYSNLGNVYSDEGNYDEALKWHKKALEIRKKYNYKGDIGRSYSNIGLVYFNQNNFEDALKNHFASLAIKKELNDKLGIAISHNNIGIVYFAQSDDETDEKKKENLYELAMQNYFSALKIQEAVGENSGTANICNNIGNVCVKRRQFDLAKSYLDRAKRILTKSGNKKYLRGTYNALTKLDSAKGNYKGAYENYKLFILYRDSLNNEESQRKTIQSQMNYDFEKKEAVAKAEHKKELEKQELVADEKSRKQTVVILFVVAGLLLVLVFSGFIFRSLRITRKQKSIIEKQKNIVEQQKQEVELQKIIVEEHQKEIIDSIMYARRIQRSLLPTDRYIERNLKRLNTKNK